MTKKRLIDVNKLIDFIDVGHLRNPGELCYSEVDVVNLLLHAPTVDDVAPVVHGKWDDSFDGITPYCTACGMSHSCMRRTPLYCPNCGAKMDGDIK